MLRKMIIALAVAVMCAAMPSFARAETATAIDPILQKAKDMVKKKNFAAAIDTVNRGIAGGQLADTYEVRLFLGAVYYKTKQYDNALAEFSRTVALDKTSRMSYWFLGHIYEAKALKAAQTGEKRGLQEKALEAWQNFLRYPRTIDTLPLSQKHMNISVEESNEQAKKHIKFLEGELHHE